MSNIPTKTTQSLGGIATSKILRQNAIEKYYLNPNICNNCGKIIEITDNEKVSTIRRKKFCSQKCNGLSKRLDIDNNELDKHTRSRRRKGVLPLKQHFENISILNKTKGELFKVRSNWQSARSAIQKSARSIFFAKYNTPKCQHKNCNYSLHVDVAHIKAVSEFADDELISNINHIDNLIGLCKNHHWEFDNGHITINDIVK